jgi:GNAT superfamily N-acetyltransferase
MTLARNHSYLRPAVAGDLEALTDLINRAFQVERFFLVDDRVDTGRVEVSMAYGQFLVLETGSALQGAVYCEIGGALPPEVGRIGMLSVEPALQGKGLGRRLVSAAEGYLRQHGCRRAELRYVDRRVDLPPFYRKLGYVEDGSDPFPEGIAVRMPCRLLRMSKKL